MSAIHSPEENPVTLRHLVVPIILVLFFGISVTQLWLLQIVQSDALKERAKMTGLILDHSLAPRGKIYDRNNVLLADVKPQVVITAKPGIASKHPEELDRLAKILGTTRAKLEWLMRQQWSKQSLPVPIFVGATIQQGTKIAEASDEFPGIGVQTLPMRSYPQPTLAPQALGWVWVPNESIEKELKDKGEEYIPPYVGRDGLERMYDDQLRGIPGTTTYTVDTRKRPLRAMMSESPRPGDTLILGLDSKVQAVAMEALAGQKGAVVALDPNTGEVLCMASTPGYSLDIFNGGLTESEADSIYQNKDIPLLKRPIAGRYPPGSTWKIVTAMAAYQAGKFSTHDAVSCPGYLTVGNRRVRCENHPAATYGFTMAFTKSCNSYFGKLAQRVGEDQLRATASGIGFGVQSGIDVPGELKGLVPSDEYVKETHKRPWSLGDTNNIGIGQGDLLVTPLQMALLACLVANEGVNYQPHLVRGILPPGEGAVLQKVERKELHRFDADQSFWLSLKGAMRNVVTSGTARAVQIPDVPVCGKTGSAENSSGRKTHAWFVGYAPATNPKIAFAVLVENAGHGGAVAAPIAKKVIEAYLVKPTQKSDSKALDIDLTLTRDSDSDPASGPEGP